MYGFHDELILPLFEMKTWGSLELKLLAFTSTNFTLLPFLMSMSVLINNFSNLNAAS